MATPHTPTPPTPARSAWNPLAWPMYLRVLAGVILGAAVGLAFRSKPFFLNWTTADLGTIAGFYIQLLTALATPLIFFAIIDAFVQTNISGRQGAKMFLICGVNILVAFTIGLVILNVWRPGRVWHGTLAGAQQQASPDASK